jgi:hypothetical protein
LAERFHRKRGVARSLRRIATAEIDAALAAIASPDADEARTIHTVRQQLKRLRALVRLPRQRLLGWREENIAFRDLGRRLAGTRDADVLAETFDKLARAAEVESARLRAQLAHSQPRADRRELLRGEIAAGLRAARERVDHWRFEGHGFALIGPGLKRIYRDMRRDEAAARAEPTPARFHEWRKQTKYHANQLALLRAAAPKIFKGYRRLADELADRLGEHHDLDALALAMRRSPDGPGRKKRRVLAAMRRRNAKLEAEAFRLGDELAAERPREFLRRIETSWESWRG